MLIDVGGQFKPLEKGLDQRKRVIFPTGLVVSCGVMMRPWNVGKL
jgi:hypothetical protein